jgi:hypothetical protein
MATPFQQPLSTYQDNSETQREKSIHSEKLVSSFLQNDANDWAIETMNNPRYPLELLQRVITVSLETVKIFNNLPRLNI